MQTKECKVTLSFLENQFYDGLESVVRRMCKPVPNFPIITTNRATRLFNYHYKKFRTSLPGVCDDEELKNQVRAPLAEIFNRHIKGIKRKSGSESEPESEVGSEIETDKSDSE